MKQKAFTLLEILLVIAAIGILAAIVIVAINPQRQLAATRNAQRINNIREINSALQQYTIQSSGILPDSIRTMSIGSTREICAHGVSESECNSLGLILLDELSPTYLAQLPVDPQSVSPRSGYLIHKFSEDRYGLISELSENADIQIIDKVPSGLSVVPNGLIQYYDLQSNSNNLSKFDFNNLTWIGNENYTLSVLNTANFSNEYAASFDGNSYLTSNSPDLDNLVTFTTSGWFRTSMPNQNRISLWGQDDIIEICMDVGTDIWLWHAEQGLYASLPGVFNDGEWYHLAITYSNGESIFYINGTDISSQVSTSNYGSWPMVSNRDFKIGEGVCDQSGGNFVGDISDVRIYDRILSPDEISQIAEIAD